MKKLLILTVEWPYGKGETFFENEAKYVMGYDEVYCMPLTKTENCRNVPENIKIINSKEYSNKTINILTGLMNTDFFKELLGLLKSNRLSLSNIKSLLRFSGMVAKRKKMLSDWISKNVSTTDILDVYTYWMASDAVAVSTQKEKYNINKFITRCHRFDLYEYAAPSGYIPYRKNILEKADCIMPISEDGLDYLVKSYSEKYKYKYKVSKLGTLDWGINSFEGNREELTIVSCSNLIPVKRVELMLEALKYVKHKINWFHFGDGVLRTNLESRIKDLPDNIKFTFKGSVKNTELMKWYQEHYVDLFVNTSESEGIPVSIMEAMSFGIPVIATNVGGSSEIVLNEYNGFLLDKDFSVNTLACLIDNYAEICIEEQMEYRKNSRAFWKNNYSADRNYFKFYSDINEC